LHLINFIFHAKGAKGNGCDCEFYSSCSCSSSWSLHLPPDSYGLTELLYLQWDNLLCSIFTSQQGDKLLIDGVKMKKDDPICVIYCAPLIISLPMPPTDPICVRAGLIYYCNQVFLQEVDGVGKILLRGCLLEFL